MKFLTFAFVLLLSTSGFCQDKIVFKNSPDTVYCKIKSLTSNNIFYIERNEHKSDFYIERSEHLRNVQYHTYKTTQITPSLSTKEAASTNSSIAGKGQIIKRQNATHIFGIIAIRNEYPVAPEGYELTHVFTLPAAGILPIVYSSPTFYVYTLK